MTKLSKKMQEAFDKMTLRFREANDKSFEEWSVDSEWCGNAKYNGFMTYEQKFQRQVERFGREEAERNAEHSRETYENARNGIVEGEWNTATLRALEGRGYIEVLHIGGGKFQGFDKVRLLTI